MVAGLSFWRWGRRRSTSWLSPERELLQPVIRAPLTAATGFKQQGHDLALAHGAPLAGRKPVAFFPRLRQNIARLHEAHRSLARQERSGQQVSAAGAWLLDNIHLVVAQTREVHDGLSRRYYRSLPVLADLELAGLPRVYGIAWAFVAAADSAFEPASLVELLRGYQQRQVLTQGELWALPTTLRVVLIENLRRLAERVAAEEAAREAAHRLFDSLASAAPGTPAPQSLFDQMRARGVTRAFALQVMQRLHADSEIGTAAGARGREAIRVALSLALPEPAAAQAQAQVDQEADNLSVSNAVRSLQLLGSADWRGLIAEASLLMQRLLTWPPFAAERDDTQDASLHAIERLARLSHRTELQVADQLLALARQPGQPDEGATAAVLASAGYWLRAEGLPVLRGALGLPTAHGAAWAARLALPAWLLTLTAGSIALVAFFVLGAGLPGMNLPAAAIAALLALWPASEVVMAVVNRLLSESLPPRRLPRLALADGIPSEHRVLVVLPVLLTDPVTVQALARQLERHHLANRERFAQFALLSDWADADQAGLPGDAALLAEALAAVDALNTRHCAGQPPRFLLLHRNRSWSDSEQAWIGWERKRGKLEQLVALLADPELPSPFLALGPCSEPAAGTPYVVTLDADTVLPPGALRELVGIAAHPLNQPHVSRNRFGRQRVTAGHGILQPRMAAAWPQQATGFHRLFAGASGGDPYNGVTSDVFQDLFDEGSFCGKGLLHVAALHAVLARRLPEGQILSHDLLEGCIARCGRVSDVTLMEPAPDHADVAASRTHRWTRGDWQLLPLLGRRRYALRGIDRFKLVDNLRRSLVAPAALALLLAALAGAPWSAWGALWLAAAALGAGPLLGALAALAPSRDDLALRHFARQVLAGLARALAGLAWLLALWLRQSLLTLDAIARALWRSRVSHRLLLQWTTAAATEASARYGLRALAPRHAGTVAVALGLALAALMLGTPAPALALGLCLLWAGTPLWVALASHVLRHAGPRPLADEDRIYCHGLARQTWQWFVEHVGPASHHLPPDNVQTVPHLLVAQRTSPTNIGLYLLAVACARAFGWITPAEMTARLTATLDTLDRLPRERGHFFNWIATDTLQTMAPAYVSTVDSGNLCGHLLAVAGACDELAAELPMQGDLNALAARCRALAEAADFSFLYNRRRRLLHIGWRQAEQQLDDGHYDLLASESRLASLWAIAKGDLPAAHWAALGRPFQASGTEVGLRSWSGSMFEYLMPLLVLDEPRDSALGRATRMAVQEQRAFARRLGLPWGVSESAYATTDRSLAYQYAPQGVPRLAMRRTPGEERVVAPYASALAAMRLPRAAVLNLRRLQSLQARSDWGFIEALDYTPERQADGSRYVRVCTFMAHHQGMTLVALANVLLQAAPRRWAMADARLAAVATLLQEQVPREVARLRDPPAEARRGEGGAGAALSACEVLPAAHGLQRTWLLSNAGSNAGGRDGYSVALRANGAGWSRLGGIDIGRWRDDALRDADGSFVYLRRGATTPVSLTQHPAPDPNAHYSAQAQGDRIAFNATWPDMRSRCTVWVSTEDDVELRRVELWNTSARAITLELISAFEVSLSEARADEMHPAFANLFISADWDAPTQALHLSRRPRRVGEPALHAVHFIAQAEDLPDGTGPPLASALADRARWRGRLHDVSRPLAEFDVQPSRSGLLQTGLDPVAALSLRLTLPAHGAAQLTFATAAAPDRATLVALVARLRQPAAVALNAELSATLAGLQQRERYVAATDLAALQTLTTLLVLLHSRPPPAAPGEEVCSRRLLWRFGLSGERPLIVVSLSTRAGLRLVRSLIQGLRHWAPGGVAVDLVVINAEPASYLMPLQQGLSALRDRQHHEQPVIGRASLTLLLASELTPSERATLALLARVRLSADGRSLAQHVSDLCAWHDAAQRTRDEQDRFSPSHPQAVAAAMPPQRHAPPRFDPLDGDCSFETSQALPTPRPWVNVLANPDFGALVSEAGGSCSWAGNSRLHQLSAWGNDPLADMTGESFWVQDLKTREIWNLGPGVGAAAVGYRVVQAPGRTRISHRHGDIEVDVVWRVDPLLALKRIGVELVNHGPRSSPLRLLGLVEWVLGAVRVDRQSVCTSWRPLQTPDGASVDVLLATQQDDHDGCAGQTAFLLVQGVGETDWTCDRRELFDARGQRAWPDQLGCSAGNGADPCAALATSLRLKAGDCMAATFIIGHAATADAALALARLSLAPDEVTTEILGNQLGAVQVSTPDPLFDVLVNHWLLHQATVCRLWGRAGFYQAGGAYGFRDQLQDAMALAVTAPHLLREQLLRAAERQFSEGDVQHWWHPHSGAGVRTRISDDLLWLPHAVHHYLQTSGDADVLDEPVAFLEGATLAADTEEAYTVPRVSERRASLYEHCARAIDHCLAVGVNGLPLMGTGDWNDGMSGVGAGGRGESVWMGWFLCRVVTDAMPWAVARNDLFRARRWVKAEAGWRLALQGPAWDGAWYRRAFFDDGRALGSKAGTECRIDLIAQAWSVLSGVAPLDRQHQAMASAERLLMDREHGLLKLLDPPLVHTAPSAGYIQAYPPGVRENGGQYSHGAVWASMAWAQLGQADAAWRAWVACSPAHRAADARQGLVYGLEPYAVAADIYSQSPYVGRGGWSWYTGSAAGLHRAAVGSICGLEVRGAQVRLQPVLPSHWRSAEIRLQRFEHDYRFTLCQPGALPEIAAAKAQGAIELPFGDWLALGVGGDRHHLVICHPHEGESHEPGSIRSPVGAVPQPSPRAVGTAER